MSDQIIDFSESDYCDLTRAKKALESESLAIKLTQMLGDKIDLALQALPDMALKVVYGASEKALEGAIAVATRTMSDTEQTSSNLFHKFAGAVTGAVGGAGGLATLSVELPITTTLIMRSILDIARSEGHDIKDPLIQMAAFEVFALGSDKTDEDDSVETGYFAVRASLRKLVQEAAETVATKGVGSSIVGKLVASVASRFGIAVSEKAMLQMVPLLGGIAGAGVNTIFIGHYQQIAHGHFIIKRLEKKYGRLEVQEQYESIDS